MLYTLFRKCEFSRRLVLRRRRYSMIRMTSFNIPKISFNRYNKIITNKNQFIVLTFILHYQPSKDKNPLKN